MKRVIDKIREIERFLDELNQIVPDNFGKYKSNIEKKAACERYVEKIVEAVTDLAFLVIKYKKLKIPEEDIDAFNILLDNAIIDKEITSKLKEAKGMRNILAHQYGKIDDKIVYDAISGELEEDVSKFVSRIRKLFESGKNTKIMSKYQNITTKFK